MKVIVIETPDSPHATELLAELASAVTPKDPRPLSYEGALAHAAVRLELRARFSRDVEILRTPNGKPYVEPGFHFNVTHTRGLAVCAFSDSPVGVDAEYYAERDFLPIAERYFSEDEIRAIRTAALPLVAFYRMWTAKESYIKMRGETLASALRTARGARLSEVRTFEFARGSGSLLPCGEQKAEGASHAVSLCPCTEPLEVWVPAAEEIAKRYLGK